MKKITLLAAALLFSTLTLSANSNGEEIFKAKCSACHMLQPPGAMEKAGTLEFKKAMNDLKAPPMAKVSSMIKMHYDTKEAYVKFMNDYITNPDASKTVCMKKAIQGFGLMPAIGKSMSDEEKTAVAEWIYDNVQASKKLRMMKCGAGKCGGGMGQGMGMGKGMGQGKGMKCAAGKCGAK
ncbi:c-type cytochrome [Sulfurovum riftiae]|uniref:Cytochrome c domain-containing protein n=1 Tax=Sulfurovum riftiae TaxID=1630136 RepID=A0A151CEP8_9BACT|nr:cytochrome c [Sulfurovum riftiae]KYJ85944.1 hypothetical protein AS592_04995 [Sulfurovum riftiae]